ncbi:MULTISPECIES: hypothetical protein [Calothrix]|uniref:ATPase involved in DNA repair n=2 Tax=Calothrix TaxID=1186 RepID=A0ABR8AEI6_9CYAN|nr:MULTISPECIES: hypothetical protein [Calothrix]MBD2198313.1 hypothetical protein [Calothrix parietina FACHB-288]MBD2226638.1 hypothetical protein [Calothrix anomala FACHB-343]
MARQKRSSQVLKNAARRAAGISSIDQNVDVGSGLTLSAYSSLIETMRSKETAYNTALSNLDRLYRDMLETEQHLADMSEHILMGIGVKYGKSSAEYGMAGGVPKNKRRKGLRGESPIVSNEPSE